MSDEIFFREVNEEIRQDRTRAIWASYGKLIIALAVLAVLLVGAYVAWREYQISQANASSDRYSQAIEQATTGEVDQALAALGALSEDGYGTYRDLARMRAASLQVDRGDPAAAVAAFDAITADGAAPDALRDMAAVRAAYVLVDSGSLDDVRQRVERLSGDAEPLRHAAREALGLAAWKAGNLDEARRFFDQLDGDQGTPSGIALRTRVMRDLIASGTTPALPAAETGTPVSPAPAAATQAPADEGAPMTAPAAAAPSAPADVSPASEPVVPALVEPSATAAPETVAPAPAGTSATPSAEPAAPAVEGAETAPAAGGTSPAAPGGAPAN